MPGPDQHPFVSFLRFQAKGLKQIFPFAENGPSPFCLLSMVTDLMPQHVKRWQKTEGTIKQM